MIWLARSLDSEYISFFHNENLCKYVAALYSIFLKIISKSNNDVGMEYEDNGYEDNANKDNPRE